MIQFICLLLHPLGETKADDTFHLMKHSVESDTLTNTQLLFFFPYKR